MVALGLTACLCWAISGTMADVKPSEKLTAHSVNAKMAPSNQASPTLLPASTDGVTPEVTTTAKQVSGDKEHVWLHAWEANVAQHEPTPPTARPRVDCGSIHVSQNTDEVTVGDVAVACSSSINNVQCYSADNGLARSFNLATIPATAGQSYTVDCVTYAVENNTVTNDPTTCGLTEPFGGDVDVDVNVYRDTNGGAPGSPTTDLQLVGTTKSTIPADADHILITATFDVPVYLIADSVMVVEVFYADGDPDTGGWGGLLWIGGNDAGQSAPTYLRSAGCGLTTFATTDSIGFPDYMVIITADGEVGLPPPEGACCWEEPAGTWNCTSNTTREDCDTHADSRWQYNVTCGQLDPACGAGACCVDEVLANCVIAVDENDCFTTQGGHLFFLHTFCEDVYSCIAVPANDECDDKVLLSGTCVNVTYNTVNATTSTLALDATPPCDDMPVRDIWFNYQIPTQWYNPATGLLENIGFGYIVITTVGSEYDTLMVAYAQPGSDCAAAPCPTDGLDGMTYVVSSPGLTPSDCSDDIVGGVRQYSALNIPLDTFQGFPGPGDCIKLRVGGWDSETGNFARAGGPGVLNIDFIPDLKGLCCFAGGACTVGYDFTQCLNAGGFYRPYTDWQEGIIDGPESLAGCCSTGCPEAGQACFNALPLASGTTTMLVHTVTHFSFQAPLVNPGESTALTIDTCGSAFDTVLSVYSDYDGPAAGNTGDCIDDGFSLVARNDTCDRSTQQEANGLVSCYDDSLASTETASCLCLSVGFDGQPAGAVYDLQPGATYYAVIGLVDARDPETTALRDQGIDPVGNYPIDPEVLLSVHFEQHAACFQCEAACPPEGVAEVETDCGTANNGCESLIGIGGPITPGTTEAIACGDIVCGTCDNDDADWYEFQITSRVTATWSVFAEFPAEAWIYSAGDAGDECNVGGFGLIASIDCLDIDLTLNLCPGTYYAVVRPNADAGGITELCGDPGTHYTGALTCVEIDSVGCCKGDTNNDGDVNGRDIDRFAWLVVNQDVLFDDFEGCFNFNWCMIDMTDDVFVDMADVTAFVDALLLKTPCPTLPLCEDPARCQLRDGGGIFADIARGIRVADDIQITEPGELTSVCWTGFYIDVTSNLECTPQSGDSADDFTITYYADAGQYPADTVIASYAVSPVKVDTGIDVDLASGAVVRVFEYTATHAALAVEVGDCMWVEIVNNTTGDCQWLWEYGQLANGIAHLNGDAGAAGSGNYSPSTVSFDTDMSFCLNLRTWKAGCGPAVGRCCFESTEEDCTLFGGSYFAGDGLCCIVTTEDICGLLAGSWSFNLDCSGGCPTYCGVAGFCQFYNQSQAWYSDADRGTAGRVCYDNFVPAATGSITEVCWQGIWLTAAPCNGATPNNFEVYYYGTTTGGLPDFTSLIASFTTTDSSLTVIQTDTGEEFAPPNTTSVWQMEGTHAPVAVTAGTCYWVSIAGTDDDCIFLWLSSDSANGGNDESAAGTYARTSATTVTDAGGADLMFCVDIGIGTNTCPTAN